MRMRRRFLLAALSGAVALLLPAVASSETSTTIEAVNAGVYTHYWSPSQVTVATGGEVPISNPTTVNHGVEWVSGPVGPTPSCPGIPVGTTEAASGKEWKGACTFTKAGTYVFYCTVHHAAMSATITVKDPGMPIVSTEAPTGPRQKEATVKGTINPEGQTASYHFAYKAITGPEQKTTVEGPLSGFTERSVSAKLSGLAPSTEYEVELVVSYGAGNTVSGTPKKFMTPAIAPPVATTGSVTAKTTTSAILNGSVNSEGLQTSYRFEWGLGTGGAYEHVTAGGSVGPEEVNHAVSAALSDLLPGTPYHYRLVAEHESSSAVGGVDHTFTTAEPSPSKELPPSGPPSEPPPAPSPGLSAPEPTVPLVTSLAQEKTVSFGPALIAGSLRLSGHGSSVRGSIGIGPPGASGRLEVDLLAKPAALGARGSKPVTVGRFVRASAPGGTLSFTVSLSAKAKAVLRRHGHLALSAKITLTPSDGAIARLTRALTLRGLR
jgi:plastocyanin